MHRMASPDVTNIASVHFWGKLDTLGKFSPKRCLDKTVTIIARGACNYVSLHVFLPTAF